MRRSVAMIFGIGAVALLAAACSSGTRHPTPRAGITGARVLPASGFGADERLVRAYTAARLMPEVFDGIYCHCRCKENFGHVSLLTCFESEHGSACDICLTEATMAAQMHERGSSLDDIRRAIDAQFRS